MTHIVALSTMCSPVYYEIEEAQIIDPETLKTLNCKVLSVKRTLFGMRKT